MNLVVVSHKLCWRRPDAPSGIVTDGGFPFHMRAMAELFDQTTVVVPVSDSPAPVGTFPLTGNNLRVAPLRNPTGVNFRRKLALLTWLPRSLPAIWREVRRADAVHIPLGSDVGTFGVFAALLMRKRLYIRYCGIWGHANTTAERFWLWLCEKLASERTVVLATGGDVKPPSARNPHIRWIFSSSMTDEEIRRLPERTYWTPTRPLRLIIVARQEAGKNTDTIIQAMPAIRAARPGTTLDVVGDGSLLSSLKTLAASLGLGDAVRFHGRLNHDGVVAALNNADLFCFPTDSEGFPKAVHEAMACGLPVVTTPVSVLPDLVGSHSGAMLKDIQPQTIAQAVIDLTADAEHYAELSANARRVAAKYTLERWRDEIGAALERAWGPTHQARNKV